MKKRSGFTLIELLAVIVILAVIALIAVLRIIEILNKARISAAEDSTMGIIEAAESYVADFMLQNQGALPSEELEFSCNSEGCKLITELEGYDTKNLDKLNYKGKNASSGTIIISNNGQNIIVANLEINGFNCNHLNNETYCGKKEYNSGDPYELGDYKWHVISDDGKYLTLLLDDGQLGDNNEMNHCTNDTDLNTDCGYDSIHGWYQYSWENSKIRLFLNNNTNDGFLTQLEQKIGADKLVATEICSDPSTSSDMYDFGGYLKSEIERINGATCNNGYVKDKVRLMTVSEVYSLSPNYSKGQKVANVIVLNIPTINKFPNLDVFYSAIWLTNNINILSDPHCARTMWQGVISNDGSQHEYRVRPVITIKK